MRFFHQSACIALFVVSLATVETTNAAVVRNMDGASNEAMHPIKLVRRGNEDVNLAAVVSKFQRSNRPLEFDQNTVDAYLEGHCGSGDEVIDIIVPWDCWATEIGGGGETEDIKAGSTVRFITLLNESGSHSKICDARGKYFAIPTNFLLPDNPQIMLENQQPPKDAKRRFLGGIQNMFGKIKGSKSHHGSQKSDHSVASVASRKSILDSAKTFIRSGKEELSPFDKLLAFRLNRIECEKSDAFGLLLKTLSSIKQNQEPAERDLFCVVNHYQDDVTANEYEHVVALLSLAYVLNTDGGDSADAYKKAFAMIFNRVKYVDENGHDITRTVSRAYEYGLKLRLFFSDYPSVQSMNTRGVENVWAYLDKHSDPLLSKYVSKSTIAVAAGMGSYTASYRLAISYIERPGEGDKKTEDYENALKMLNEVSAVDKTATECPHLWYYQAFCVEKLSEIGESPVAHIYSTKGELRDGLSVEDIYLRWYKKMKPLTDAQRGFTSGQRKAWQVVKAIKRGRDKASEQRR